MQPVPDTEQGPSPSSLRISSQRVDLSLELLRASSSDDQSLASPSALLAAGLESGQGHRLRSVRRVTSSGAVSSSQFHSTASPGPSQTELNQLFQILIADQQARENEKQQLGLARAQVSASATRIAQLENALEERTRQLQQMEALREHALKMQQLYESTASQLSQCVDLLQAKTRECQELQSQLLTLVVAQQQDQSSPYSQVKEVEALLEQSRVNETRLGARINEMESKLQGRLIEMERARVDSRIFDDLKGKVQRSEKRIQELEQLLLLQQVQLQGEASGSHAVSTAPAVGWGSELIMISPELPLKALNPLSTLPVVGDVPLPSQNPVLPSDVAKYLLPSSVAMGQLATDTALIRDQQVTGADAFVLPYRRPSPKDMSRTLTDISSTKTIATSTSEDGTSDATAQNARLRAKPDVEPGPCLYVGFLGWWVTEKDLEDYFGPYGELKSIKVLITKKTGRSREQAFVEYTTTEAATQAMRWLDGIDYPALVKQLGCGGLVVKYADQKSNRS